MSSQTPRTDETLLSRVECKYLVSREQQAGIREFIQPFVFPDRFARDHADGRYPVSSLYLDSPNLALYQSTAQGLKNRFKLRIRTYSDAPSDPTFFEVKKRMNGIVYKFREAVSREEAVDLLDRTSLEAPTDTDLSKFISLRELHGAEPLMRVKYMREAYVSQNADPVRITFDDELQGAVTLDPELSHESGDWITVPMDHTILEVKFTNLYPSWVGKLVQEFQLERTSVPKYVLCVEEANRCGVMRMAV
jgi:hypothetical protein